MSKPTEPVSLATEAMQLVHTLAQRGAYPARVEREVSAMISGWIEAGCAGALDVSEALGEQITTAIEDTSAEAENLDREDAAGTRAGGVIPCLDAAREAAQAALVAL